MNGLVPLPLEPQVAVRATPSSAALAAAALVLLLTQAWVSDGYFHPDEYFQTVEFASYKLGLTAPAELPWEFAERLRPFLQPAVYHAVARALGAVGVEDPGVALLAFRSLGAVLGWAAIVLLWRALAPRLPDERRRTLLLFACGFAWYLPFVLVRSSSESFAASFLAMGVAAFLILDRRGRPAAAAIIAGLALGVAFEARYQVALAIVGFVAWLAMVRRSRAAATACAGGVLIVIALGLVVDRWGYGDWTVTPWNYVRVNLLEGKAAAVYGRAPPWFYLSSLASRHAPLSTLLLAATLVFWWRAPRDPLTWTTLPFFAGHALLPRKEPRFLIPLAILAAAMAGLVLLDGGLWRSVAARVGRRTRRSLLVGLLVLDLAFAGALLLLPVRHDLSVQLRIRDILEATPAAPFLVFGDDPFIDKGHPMPFVRPAAWAPARMRSWTDAEPSLGAGARGTFIVAALGQLPPPALRSRLRLLESPLPERVARALPTVVGRTRMRALWVVER